MPLPSIKILLQNQQRHHRQKPKRPEKSARLEEVQQERARDKHRLCTVGRLLHDVHARKIVGVPVVIVMPKAVLPCGIVQDTLFVVRQHLHELVILIALLTKAVTPLQQVYNRHRR